MDSVCRKTCFLVKTIDNFIKIKYIVLTMKQYIKLIGTEMDKNDFDLITKAAQVDKRSRASLLRKGGLDLAKKILGEINGAGKN